MRSTKLCGEEVRGTFRSGLGWSGEESSCVVCLKRMGWSREGSYWEAVGGKIE